MKKLIYFQVYDYQKTYYSLKNKDPETYLYQKQFSEFTASLINKHEIKEVCVVCFGVAAEYDQILPNGIRAKGIPFSLTDQNQTQIAKKFIDLYAPTHAIVLVPLSKLIKYCTLKKIKTLVMIADSFTGTGLRGLISCWRFAWILNNKYVELVSNHNYPASCLLKSFGVYDQKIVPWDFTWDIDVDKYPAKVFKENQQVWKFFYAGRIMAEKGVSDIIKAIYFLKKKNRDAKAVFAGGGNISEFEKQAADLGIADRIKFLGIVAHEQVLSGMRDADIVLVPSQIKSSEGMACTIYESFLVKTPLILSDHPVFREAVKNGVFFKAGNSNSLAKAINALLDNPLLYNQLSRNSAAALKKLIVPFNSIEIINHWLSGLDADKQWLLEHSLLKLKKLN
ncbi:MAG: glycosyltransferase [Candidatus Omnitrophica bacterium]|nr:glycosyltransferase [Candidatus Omnitrophota bacterium]